MADRPAEPVFVLAILKGAVEGDPYAHFAALGGFDHHVADAVACGFVTGTGAEVQPTAEGRAFYAEARLARLPPGRAYLWHGPVREHAEATLRASLR